MGAVVSVAAPAVGPAEAVAPADAVGSVVVAVVVRWPASPNSGLRFEQRRAV